VNCPLIGHPFPVALVIESKDVMIIACCVTGPVEGQGPAIYVGHSTQSNVEILVVEGALACKEDNFSITSIDTASEG
jgi:hypothetical protein